MARRIVEAWRLDYNDCRPHTSIGGLAPNEFAAGSQQDCSRNGLWLRQQFRAHGILVAICPSRTTVQRLRGDFRSRQLISGRGVSALLEGVRR
jgi:hypothetical protein